MELNAFQQSPMRKNKQCRVYQCNWSWFSNFLLHHTDEWSKRESRTVTWLSELTKIITIHSLVDHVSCRELMWFKIRGLVGKVVCTWSKHLTKKKYLRVWFRLKISHVSGMIIRLFSNYLRPSCLHHSHRSMCTKANPSFTGCRLCYM